MFESNDPTNTMHARTTGAIALGLTGNNQGGYFFLSLTTGKRISRQQWTKIPMPDGVVEQVENMARIQKQPVFDIDGPNFEWSPGMKVENHDDDAYMDKDNREHNDGFDEESIEVDLMEENVEEINQDVSEEEDFDESTIFDETEEPSEPEDIDYVSDQDTIDNDETLEIEAAEDNINEAVDVIVITPNFIGGHNLRLNRHPAYN